MYLSPEVYFFLNKSSLGADSAPSAGEGRYKRFAQLGLEKLSSVAAYAEPFRGTPLSAPLRERSPQHRRNNSSQTRC